MYLDIFKTSLTVEQYSLAASLKANERRVTAVGSGFKTKNSRSRQTAKVLNWGVRNFDTIMVSEKDKVIFTPNIWLGKKGRVEVVANESLYLTVPKRKKKIIKATIEYNSPIKAPIKKGDKIGVLNVYLSGELKKTIDMLSNENIKRANIFSRLFKSLNFLVWGDA